MFSAGGFRCDGNTAFECKVNGLKEVCAARIPTKTKYSSKGQ